MKKRNRNKNRNHLKNAHRKGGHRRRQKTNWQFEQLESRFVFSASPIDLTELSTATVSLGNSSWNVVSLSNDTPAGAEALWLRELEWTYRQAAAAGGYASDIGYEANSLPNDPMFPWQWHLLNTGNPNIPVGDPDFPQPLLGVAGEDINVVPVWNMGYTGEGVVVAVIDTGVQTSHPDLAGNLHPTLRYNAINGSNNPNPVLIDNGAPHGTAVAALIAAIWNNAGEQAVNLIGGQEYPVFDQDGNPVMSGGGTGVAPNATIVPIRFIGTGTGPDAAADSLEFAWDQIDISNNSWGPAADRFIPGPLTPDEITILRESIRFGRDGLGTIYVFSSGNSGGPAFTPGFESFGAFDSSSYNPWTNSRYTIAVTGVDHDGMYANFDGTFTSYPEAGAAVLVAAPTGSNVAQNVAEDQGQGSGIWTADLRNDFGYNAAANPIDGLDPDFDFWPDADYTARFNGTSASAPIATGVIALMLEANPELTYRDVQEILVRSARQNAQFEIPSSGGITGERSTWQTNQLGLFRNPDPWSPIEDPVQAQFDPIADPNFPFDSPQNFPASRNLAHYEAQPAVFTNGAGYTVSQGYGVYFEQLGYGHGTIDAELAVKMAEQWHTLGQNLNPNTERTFTTFVLQNLGTIPAAEKVDPTGMLVPGGIGGTSGFIDYWDEYFEDMPFADYTGPFEDARGSFITFNVPDNQAINLEWVEVKVEINGPADDFDFLRIMLVSPDGTHSDLSNFYWDPDHNPFSTQPAIGEHRAVDPGGDLTAGNMVWTFSTNRIWGERTSDALIYDPITGEPFLMEDPDLGPQEAFQRGWELHIENWSDSNYTLAGLEIVWHGKPLALGTQRVQGIIGIDENSDNEFNYTRYTQEVTSDDPTQVRSTQVTREMYYEFNDLNGNEELDPGEQQFREGFAENMLVEAYRVVDGVVEDNAIARFLTGADGNYYFDLVPDEYVIRVTDPLERILLDDADTPSEYLQHYRSEWHITEDWFYAQDRELVDPLDFNELPEVLFDEMLGAPVKFLDGLGNPIQTGIKNLNFLVKDPAPVNEFIVNGAVFADINANGVVDGNDTTFGGVRVYWDQNQNGIFDAGELNTLTSEDPLTRGNYTLTIPAFAAGTFSIGVVTPTSDWLHTNPASGVQSVFARPGDIIGNLNNADINDGDVNFLLDPPDSLFPPGGDGLPGTIFGVIFQDKNGDGVRDPGDDGIAGFRVFIDANENGIFDDDELESITGSNGGYSFVDVAPGLIRLDVEHGDAWALTQPSQGYREVLLGNGGAATGQNFGLKNLADRDWGNLPNTFSTTTGASGPSHVIVPGFHLGSKIFGDIDGVPMANPDDAGDNDGVVILSNGGVLQPGLNTIQVTVAGVGGLLNGWIDWDGDGTFAGDPNEQVFTNVDLNPGTYNLSVFAPENIAAGMLGARFRWSEDTVSFTGPAAIGEVEDYIWASTNVPPIVLPGDYNQDGVVDDTDLGLWGATFGSTTDLRADGNGNNIVDIADYLIVRNNMGAMLPPAGAGASSGVGSGSLTGSSDSSSEPQGESSVSGGGFAAYGLSSGGNFGGGFQGSSGSLSGSTSSSQSQSSSERNEMLDLAFATLDSDGYETGLTDERDTFDEQQEEISELALAVAMEESPWWSH